MAVTKQKRIEYIKERVETVQMYIDTVKEQIEKGAKLHKSLKRDSEELEVLKSILSELEK